LRYFTTMAETSRLENAHDLPARALEAAVAVARAHPDRQPSVAEAAEALQELHWALRDFPGELPYLAPPLVEVPRLLDRIERQGDLAASDLILLRNAYERLAPILRSPARPAQALHGDAHLRNLTATANGLLRRCSPAGEGRGQALGTIFAYSRAPSLA
jgi:hypothetical protein